MYGKFEETPAGWRTHKDAPLALDQINKLAEIYDALKKKSDQEDPTASAWMAWEKLYELKDGKWVTKSQSEKFASMDLEKGELRDVEILSVGTWNNTKFTESDLDNLAENFGKIGLRVPLKLGHGKDQKYAQREGRPAFGWVTSVKRVGAKLFADISNIPRKLLELVEKKHWVRFSIEMIRNFRYRGNVYANVLEGLALLGDEMPAVQTLDDIYNLHAANAETYSEEWPESQILLLDQKQDEKGGKTDMEQIEKLQKDLAAEQEKNVKLTAERDEAKAQSDAIKADAEKREKLARSENIKLSVEAGIKGMKIPPAAREIVTALALKAEGLIEERHTFKEGEKEVSLDTTDAAELIVKLSEALPKGAHTTETSTETKPPEGDQDDEKQEGERKYMTGAQQHERITKVMKEQSIDYVAAYDIVAQEQADAARKEE